MWQATLFYAIVTYHCDNIGQIRDIDLRDQVVVFATPGGMVHYQLSENVQVYDQNRKEYISVKAIKTGSLAIPVRHQNNVVRIFLIDNGLTKENTIEGSSRKPRY